MLTLFDVGSKELVEARGVDAEKNNSQSGALVTREALGDLQHSVG